MQPYRAFLLTLFALLDYLAPGTASLHILMFDDKLIQRYQKSELRLQQKDPRYPNKKHWRYEQSVHHTYGKKQIALRFSISQDIALIEDSNTNKFHPFDPDPTMPKLLFREKAVDEIPNAMKEMEALDQYKKHMMSKYKWSAAIWDQIDWETFNRAMSARPGGSVSLRKYVHGWLPVVNLVRHYGPDKIKVCPNCKGEEHQDHLFRCTALHQRTAWDVHWAAFQLKIRSTMPNLLFCHLISNMRSWTKNTAHKANISRVTPAIRTAATQQNKIGWDQMFLGRISLEYRKVHAALTHPEDPAAGAPQAATWGKLFVSLLWELFELVWSK